MIAPTKALGTVMLILCAILASPAAVSAQCKGCEGGRCLLGCGTDGSACGACGDSGGGCMTVGDPKCEGKAGFLGLDGTIRLATTDDAQWDTIDSVGSPSDGVRTLFIERRVTSADQQIHRRSCDGSIVARRYSVVFAQHLRSESRRIHL